MDRVDKVYKVLVLEDSIDDLELYERILKKTLSCTITHFTSAEEAIKHLENGYIYDLAFIDYHLRGMNGVEFLELAQQKKIKPDSPIIILTGQGNEDIAVNFMRLGVTDYLQKNNVSFVTLSNSIRSALEQYRINKIENEKHKSLLLFAHTLAHDLRSPINRIKSYCRLLTKCAPSKQREYIDNLVDDSNFLTQFIDKLLSYAEFGRLPITKGGADLNKVIEQSLKNLELDIVERGAVIQMPEKTLPVINGSEVSLVQLFQNIISNSIKYSGKDSIIKIDSAVQKNSVTISVIDHGIGIPKEDRDSVFEPFIRLANSAGTFGTGLGLALVKTIADQHNATISISSPEDGGTKFDINFWRPL